MSSSRGLSIAPWSALLLLARCALDLPAGARDRWALGALAVLALALGALSGALWELAFATLARAPRRLAGGVWLLASALLAAWACADLGVLARLGGAHHALALTGLLGAVAGAPLLAALLLALQPSAHRPLGSIAGAGTRARIGSACLLAAAALACDLSDRHVYVGLYPSMHLALRAFVLWLGSFALALGSARAARRPWTSWGAFLLLGAIGVALGGRGERGLAVLAARDWPGSVLTVARTITDVDRDGESAWLGGGDCAPFDPAVHPAAAEIAGNGIDDNCLLGDATKVASNRERLPMPAQPSPLDVVLITVDSLRADRVGAYCAGCGSAGLATTPNLDAFARDALVFERAYSPGGWTSIAISALMRGTYPRRLDWTRAFETNRYRLLRAGELGRLHAGERTVKMFPLPLADAHPSIAHWLGQRGMDTIAVVDDEYSELLARDSALAPGFARYREIDELAPAQRGDAATVDVALRELAAVPAGRRCFLWVHLFGPHSPSRVHDGVRLDGPSPAQRYEHEIRFSDLQLGRLLRALDARPMPTAIFVSADHGEEFFGSGRHHGWSVREAALHVPLIARVPGWPHGRAQLPVSLVDLMPTILELTGTPVPRGLDGIALGALLHGGDAPARVLFADTWRYDGDGRLLLLQSAALAGSDKVVYEPLAGGFTRYQAGDQQPQPIDPNAPLPALRALAGYVESSNGPFRLHD